MKNIFIITIVFSLVSCKNTNEIQRKQRTEKPVQITAVEETAFWNIPNENTTTEILKLNTSINDTALLSVLKPYLTKQKFLITTSKVSQGNSYKNCKDNVILKLEGKGLKSYGVKRTEAKPKNYYPDFNMWIYEFENESLAKSAENKIREAFKSSNRFCNGKEPNYLVLYGNKIIHLKTRAEMFRGYIKDVVEKINEHR